jgi:circadian clock protein KaiB
MSGIPSKAGLRLRLYVAGNAPNSLRAIENANAICREHFAAQYDLEIVDLLVEPQRGLDDGIIVTPTLLKISPLPAHRIVGNLADRSRVFLALASK